jgi:energy-coupling factor transport system permease protein
VRSALAYTPRPGALQAASPGAAVAYLGSFVAVSFLYSNPVVLAAAGAGLALAGLLAGARGALRWVLLVGPGLALPIAIVNALVVDRGETVLARLGHWPLLGQIDVTLEGIVAGAVIALLVMVTLTATAIYSACVDPDRVLRALRPLAGRSALTATLVSRLFSVALADAGRLRDAARLRGPGAAEVGLAALARRLLAGSLDRSVDVAATLELRGYGLEAPGVGRRGEPSRYDRRFYCVAALVLAGGIAARVLGGDGFRTYPTIELTLGPATAALAVLLVLSGVAPLRRRPRRARRRRRRTLSPALEAPRV